MGNDEKSTDAERSLDSSGSPRQNKLQIIKPLCGGATADSKYTNVTLITVVDASKKNI